ncbi:MAG: S9 family peptidase [Polyangiales bacterium]
MNPLKLGVCLSVSVLFACGARDARPTTPEPAPGAPAPQAAATAARVAASARDDLIPRSVLFGNPERAGVQLSPDGKQLAWLAPRDGVLNVWVAPIDALDQAKPVTADKTRPVQVYAWTYDRTHLIYLQDKGGDENYHVFRVNPATSEVVDLTPIDGVRAELFGLSERKPGTLVVGLNDRDPALHDVWAIDLKTAEKTKLVENTAGYAGFALDHDLRVRFASKMEKDGSFARFAYDPKAKTFAPYDQTAPDDVLTSGFVGFDKLGTSFYEADSRDRDTGALYLVDAKTKKRKLVYEDARVDVGDTALVHPTEHRVEAVRVDYDKPRWVALDKRVQPDLDGIAKLGEGSAQVVSRSLDDKTWIVSLAADRGSPKYYRWDRQKRAGTFLFSVQPKLDAQPLVPMQPVVIPARDGLSLVSYLTLPSAQDANADGKADKAGPLVLLVHGGPWGRDQWGFNPLHQLLANRGYAVLSVNFRASTGFGKRFANAGDKQWGKAMHHDLLDAVQWAVKEGVAEKERVCIMGGSYGGYATLAGLTLTPDTFACGVDIVGPSSIVTLLETIPPYWAPMISLFHTRVGDPTTDEGKRALLEVSPLTHADKIVRPLLIGQGANDPRVKKSESDQIVKAMNDKRIPVSYVVFPDEGHGFARPENDVAFFAVTEAFLAVHLGGVYQPIQESELSASSLTIEHGRESLPGLPLARAR